MDSPPWKRAEVIGHDLEEIQVSLPCRLQKSWKWLWNQFLIDVEWPQHIFMGGNLIFHSLEGLTTMKDRAEVIQKPTGANRILKSKCHMTIGVDLLFNTSIHLLLEHLSAMVDHHKWQTRDTTSQNSSLGPKGFPSLNNRNWLKLKLRTKDLVKTHFDQWYYLHSCQGWLHSWGLYPPPLFL